MAGGLVRLGRWRLSLPPLVVRMAQLGTDGPTGGYFDAAFGVSPFARDSGSTGRKTASASASAE